jgi:hypothetical protein
MSVDRLPSGRWRVRSPGVRSGTFPTKREADARDRQIKDAKMRGDLDLLDAGRVTLAEFWAGDYASHYRSLSPKTRAVYGSAWHRHIEPRLGAVPLVRLRVGVVSRFQDDLRRASVGAAAIEKTMSALSNVLGRAEAFEAIPRNPVSKVKVQKARRRRVRPLAPATVEALRNARFPLGGRPDGRMVRFDVRGRMIISLFAYARLRPQELHAPFGPRWVDLGERTLLIKSPKTENHGYDSRTVDLLGPLREDLLEWRMAQGRPGDHEFIIPGQRGEDGWSQASYHRWRANYFLPAMGAIGYDRETMEANGLPRRHAVLAAPQLRQPAARGRAPARLRGRSTGPLHCRLWEHYEHLIKDLGPDVIDPEQRIRKAREERRLRLAR